MRVTFGVSAMSKSRNRSSRDDKSLDTIDPIENELRRMAGNSQDADWRFAETWLLRAMSGEKDDGC